MSFDLNEAIAYYRRQGAPGDQNTLVHLLREIQEEYGSISTDILAEIASEYRIRESFLIAIVRRYPRLRLRNTHTLELCGGPNCSRSAALAELAEDLAKQYSITFKRVPCMRQCGKGPNLRWDGTLFHKADEALLRRLIQEGKP